MRESYPYNGYGYGNGTSYNNCGNSFDDSIVQEWGREVCTEDSDMPISTWRSLTSAQQELLVSNEAEANGIQRPIGYDVSFHYNARVESHHFGRNHPMKPWRLTLTKQLILSYGLHYAMDLYESRKATKDELAEFHNRDYLDFLSSIHPEIEFDESKRSRFLGSADTSADCPIFDGMWDYFTLYTGASLDAARNLVSGQSDIAINWSGGLHHAHKGMGAGFCYINDIVLAIQQLLTVVPRVLYIDIDVHHGDGVEEAFHSTDRVLTLSFHKYGEGFFPGTGGIHETGPRSPKSPDNMDRESPGAHHGLNVPLKDGINDQQWCDLFSQITGPVIETYDPKAIVLQCGADSLGGDRLGNFNINIKAHGFCVEFVKRYRHGRKLMLIGGGGYTPRNVARCWTHETSICTDVKLRNILPTHVPYRQAFMTEEHGNGVLYPRLDNIPGKIHQNTHDDDYLQGLVRNIREQLRYLKGAPSSQMHRLPNDYLKIREEVDAEVREEEEDRERGEVDRRRREKNVGGRAEYRGV
jgi:histone deacetylase HOS2